MFRIQSGDREWKAGIGMEANGKQELLFVPGVILPTPSLTFRSNFLKQAEETKRYYDANGCLSLRLFQH